MEALSAALSDADPGEAQSLGDRVDQATAEWVELRKATAKILGPGPKRNKTA